MFNFYYLFLSFIHLNSVNSADLMAALPESAFYDENSIDVIESEVRFFFTVWVVLDFWPGKNSRAPHPPLLTQINKGDYNARSNRGLLRLYQLYPMRAKAEVIDLILLRALSALPEPDFVHVLSMIPENRMTANVAALVNLEQFLRNARFPDFWKAAAAAEVAPLVARAPGFSEAARAFAVGVLSRTYRRISVSVLAESIGLDEPATTTWVRGMGWNIEGGIAELPALPENTLRPVKKAGEDGLGLRYQDVANVLGGMH